MGSRLPQLSQDYGRGRRLLRPGAPLNEARQVAAECVPQDEEDTPKYYSQQGCDTARAPAPPPPPPPPPEDVVTLPFQMADGNVAADTKPGLSLYCRMPASAALASTLPPPTPTHDSPPSPPPPPRRSTAAAAAAAAAGLATLTLTKG
ncbi:unnamed protein product [Merluccius merluccius]